MDRAECMKVIATLRAAYPTFYKALPRDEFEAMVRLWEVQFKGERYQDVVLACHSLIATRTNTFPPVIGEIKQALHKTLNPDDTEDGQAWDRVMKCIGRGTVHSREDWEKLDPVTKDTVSPDWIKRQAESEDFIESVVKAQFLKDRAVIRERYRTADVMPQGIAEALRKRIEAPQSAFRLEGGETPAEREKTAEIAPQPPKKGINIREYLRKRRESA